MTQLIEKRLNDAIKIFDWASIASDIKDVREDSIQNLKIKFKTESSFLDEALHSLSEDILPIRKQIDIANFLICLGANTNALSIKNETPIDLAYKINNIEFANFLKRNGGEKNFEVRTQKFKVLKKEALCLLSSIKKYRRSRLNDWKCLSKYLDYQKNYINYHPFGWKPIYKKITKIEETPRTGNLVFANFYTNSKFPWPRHLDKPMAPVLQIDLSTIQNKFKHSKQISEFPYHSGLLQVWEGKKTEDNIESSFIRIIPKGEFDLDCITDERPVINLNDYFCTVRAGYGSNNGYGATIACWKKLPLIFTSGYIELNDIECKPQCEAEQNAIDVEETVTNLVEENRLSYNESHLFGVDSVSSSGCKNQLNGWQNLFEFCNEDKDYWIAEGSLSAQLLWNDDNFLFRFCN